MNRAFQSSMLYVIAGLALSALLTSCATVPDDNGKDASTTKPEIDVEVSQGGRIQFDANAGADDFQLLPGSQPAVGAIEGDLQFLNKGKEDVFNVEEFRRLLEVEEKPSGIDLNFENADIKKVVQLIIGKIMRQNYLIDPAVKGTITLKTERPLNRDTVFYMLENILDLYEARIVKRKGHYRIFPKGKEGVSIVGFGEIDDRIKLGYGYRVVPLQYVSASEMVKILESVTAKETVIRADDTRNLVIIGGSSGDVSNMIDAISMFDVDWMKGNYVGLIRIQYSAAEDVIADLRKMLATQEGEQTSGGVLTMQNIERLNAIMVITRQYSYLQRVKEWIDKLDVPTQGVGSKLYVYQVKNSAAKELAATLEQLFSADEEKQQEETVTLGNTLSPGAKGIKLTEFGKQPADTAAAKPAPAPAPAPSDELGDITGISIIAAEDTNSLLISATPNQYAKIELALSKLDVPPLQVLIEVSIMDVQLTDDFAYGLQWFVDHGSAGSSGSAVIGDQLSFARTFSYAGVRDGGDLRVALGLLASDGKVDVLSSPSVLVRNNQKASIRVGDQQPISTSVVNDTGDIVATSVEFKDTGILLEIKPSITSSGTINVELTQEIIDVGDIDTATGQRTFLNRNLSTNVSVDNGESIVLGGLIRTNKAVSESGVPWLRKIPILGALFGQTITSDVRTELLIMLSPRIIRNPEENSKVVNEYREKFRHLDL